MPAPKHSKAATKAHPAPKRENFKAAKAYAEACRLVSEARVAFDRPKSKYNKIAILESIAAGLADGQTLRAMCRVDGMPSYHTVYNWINDSPDMISHIAQAREAGYDCIADQIIEIIDDSSKDVIVAEDGSERANSEVVARSRLRAEMRLKLLAKWSPKRYGDKLALGGADDLPPIRQDVSISPEDAYRRLING